MGNPDCQIHAATHCTLSTSELCFVVLSEKNPAAMQSWVCRLSEAPCRTRVCWIIRCSLPSEVSQLPNLAPYFLLVGSCRVSWVVQALKPATTTQQYQGHVVCNLLLDGPLLHFFPWQPLEGVRRISIVRLVELLTIVWIVLALFGICPISAANKCTSSIPSNPHLQCQIWVIFFNWVLVTTYIMFFDDFEGRHFTLPSMQRVFDLSSDCSAFWFRCCFSGAFLHLEIRTVLCSDSLFDTKPINVKSWEHDPQSNLSLFAKFGAQPSLMPCPVARFGYPQISAHAKWFDITTKHATGHGGWATSVSTMPQLSYQCCARTQVLLKFPTWWEHLSDVDAVDGCWGYSQSIILVEPCCTRLRRPWWGA